MTVLERIKEYDKEEMVNFLYHFARDIINHFTNFMIPDKKSIENFLEKEIPYDED